MSAPIPVAESERPLFDAIKKHEELRAMARELGLQKANIQNQLATGRYIGEAGRQKLANRARDIEVTLGTVKRRAGEAAVERQKAEQILRRSAFGGTAAYATLTPPGNPPPAPVAPAAVEAPAPFFNAAQVAHLRLLMVRARDREMKISARLTSALDLIAIVEPLIRRDGGVQ